MSVVVALLGALGLVALVLRGPPQRFARPGHPVEVLARRLGITLTGPPGRRRGTAVLQGNPVELGYHSLALEGLPPRLGLSSEPSERAPSPTRLGDPWLDEHAGLTWAGDGARLTALFDAPSRSALRAALTTFPAQGGATRLHYTLPTGAPVEDIALTIRRACELLEALRVRQRAPVEAALVDLVSHDPEARVRARALSYWATLHGGAAPREGGVLEAAFVDEAAAVRVTARWLARSTPAAPEDIAELDAESLLPDTWMLLATLLPELDGASRLALQRLTWTHPDKRVADAYELALEALPSEARSTLWQEALSGEGPWVPPARLARVLRHSRRDASARLRPGLLRAIEHHDEALQLVAVELLGDVGGSEALAPLGRLAGASGALGEAGRAALTSLRGRLHGPEAGHLALAEESPLGALSDVGPAGAVSVAEGPRAGAEPNAGAEPDSGAEPDTGGFPR